MTYPNVSAALDFDTDATYNVSPQRLLWHLNKLGFAGQVSEYLGVFWWSQRKRAGDVRWSSAVASFGGTWAPGDVATINIGSVAFQKIAAQWDTADTIAAHFAYYINAGSVAMWAEKTGAGQVTIHTRTPNWGDAISTSKQSETGTLSTSGNLGQGSNGHWEIDASAASPINYPVSRWQADLFNTAAAAGLLVTTSFSMELVHPPDDGSSENAWIARFEDGAPVETATGFMNLNSSQCAPITNLTTYQKLVYSQMAGLQSAAGLTPCLQFGEFLWWYFSSKQNVPVGYAAYTSPISIGVERPHGFASGDRVIGW